MLQRYEFIPEQCVISSPGPSMQPPLGNFSLGRRGLEAHPRYCIHLASFMPIFHWINHDLLGVRYCPCMPSGALGHSMCSENVCWANEGLDCILQGRAYESGITSIALSILHIWHSVWYPARAQGIDWLGRWIHEWIMRSEAPSARWGWAVLRDGSQVLYLTADSGPLAVWVSPSLGRPELGERV